MAAAAEEASTAPSGRPEEEGSEGEEEAMAVLDFDMLCASVAMSAERRKGAGMEAAAACAGAGGGQGAAGGGGVQRMWEGDVVIDCLEDRRIALEAACCPCYRFGKNMRRANLGSCFLQAMAYFISLVAVLVSLIAFSVTRHHVYLYMGLGSVLLIAIYTGYFRRRIRKQFNIREARTLEMNNVQCGVWHGRGDTICLGSNGEGNKAFTALHKSPFVLIKSPELCGMDRISSGADEHQPLVPSAQPGQE